MNNQYLIMQERASARNEEQLFRWPLPHNWRIDRVTLASPATSFVWNHTRNLVMRFQNWNVNIASAAYAKHFRSCSERVPVQHTDLKRRAYAQLAE